MRQDGKATLLSIKAPLIRVYQGKEESRILEKEIEEGLAEGRMIVV